MAECDKTISIITQCFLRGFWAVDQSAATRANAEARLAEVLPSWPYLFFGYFFFLLFRPLIFCSLCRLKMLKAPTRRATRTVVMMMMKLAPIVITQRRCETRVEFKAMYIRSLSVPVPKLFFPRRFHVVDLREMFCLYACTMVE